MGPEKIEEDRTSFLSRACRLPRKIADRVSELSYTLYKDHLKPLRSESNFPYKFLAIAIVLLIYLPWFLELSFYIPPQIELTLGDEVDRTPYCEINQIPEAGVTHAVLLNNTPFTLSNDWELQNRPNDWNEYDINRYARTESDGYHLEYPLADESGIVFARMIQIPLFYYSDISISVELEGISGDARIYLEVIANEAFKSGEADIIADQIVNLNVSAPLLEARQDASSWLGSIFFKLWINLPEGAHIIVRSVIIVADFTTNLSHVQLDIQSTENVSLYENSNMKEIESPPQIMIVRNNNSSSAAVYSPVRSHDEIYLPPGIYEGMAYWQLHNQELPDPNNTTSWTPIMNFTVLEDTALEVDVKLFALRLDIDLSPSVMLEFFHLDFMEDYLYSISPYIVGSTLYHPFSDYFFIPGGVGALSIVMSTLPTFWFGVGPGWQKTQHFHIIAGTFLSASNSSRNLLLRVSLPYVTIGAAIFGLGEFAFLAVEGALLIGFAITLHRNLRHSDLRNRLSDSRLLSIILLGVSILLPWSTQIQTSPGSMYDTVYSISWFSEPIMVRWSDSTSMQFLCVTRDWWNASLISTFLLFMPLFYSCLSLSSPEKEKFDQSFAFALFLPYLVVLSGFSFSVLSISTISIGPLLAIAALPIWLLRRSLRRLGLTK